MGVDLPSFVACCGCTLTFGEPRQSKKTKVQNEDVESFDWFCDEIPAILSRRLDHTALCQFYELCSRIAGEDLKEKGRCPAPILLFFTRKEQRKHANDGSKEGKEQSCRGEYITSSVVLSLLKQLTGNELARLQRHVSSVSRYVRRSRRRAITMRGSACRGARKGLVLCGMGSIGWQLANRA